MNLSEGAGADAAPEELLRSFIHRFDARKQELIRSVRSAMRERLPTANELLYDYGTFFVITYSSTDHPNEGIAAISARPDGVRLYLMPGPKLPDPEKLLEGSGKEVRFIRIEDSGQLSDPYVVALIAAAVDLAKSPLPTEGRGKLVVRSAGNNKRASRKSGK